MPKVVVVGVVGDSEEEEEGWGGAVFERLKMLRRKKGLRGLGLGGSVG